jgi:hypothetical protein
LPEWQPRGGARHLLPSLSLLTADDYAFCFEVSGLTRGAWTDWVATATVGPHRFGGLPSASDGIRADVDVVLSDRPVERVRVRVRVAPADALHRPWLATLSACDLVPASADVATPNGPGPAVPVPALSQMAEAPAIRDRICSPTSVAMVLGSLGRPASATALAADMLHAELDRYGVWPAAIRAAARRGVAGYLLRFPDWSTAAWMLARGVPLIVSVRYDAGELPGAAIAATSGHLLVLRGWDGADVLVNDPAAPTADDVARRYALRDFCRVWLERTGIAYVLFTP